MEKRKNTAQTSRRLMDLIEPIVGVVAAKKIARHPNATVREMRVASVSELVATYKVTLNAAEKLRAAMNLGQQMSEEKLVRGEPIRSSRDTFRHFQDMRDLGTEEFHVVLLDGKHRVIRDIMISKGTLTSSPVHPREVFRPAISHGAAAIVLIHNHPSGDPTASGDDLDVTRRLVDVGELIGIRVLDHIIIGDGRFTSLADRGLMHGGGR